jgi:hypothetical protein
VYPLAINSHVLSLLSNIEDFHKLSLADRRLNPVLFILCFCPLKIGGGHLVSRLSESFRSTLDIGQVAQKSNMHLQKEDNVPGLFAPVPLAWSAPAFSTPLPSPSLTSVLLCIVLSAEEYCVTPDVPALDMPPLDTTDMPGVAFLDGAAREFPPTIETPFDAPRDSMPRDRGPREGPAPEA